MNLPLSLPILLLWNLPAGGAQEVSTVIELDTFAVTLEQGAWETPIFDPFGLMGMEGPPEGEPLQSPQVLYVLEEILGRGGQGLSIRSVADGNESTAVELTGPADRVAEARDLLTFLEEQLHATRRFEVFSFRSDAVSPAVDSSGSVLSPGDAEARVAAIRESGTAVQRFVLAMRSGETATIDARREIGFLADYNTEIASGAFGYDPIYCFPRLGELLVARATGEGDGARLSLFLRHGAETGPVTRQDVPFGGLIGQPQSSVGPMATTMQLESMEVATHSFGFEAVLRAGEGLELSIRSSLGEEAGSSYLIRALDVGRGPIRRKAMRDRELLLVESQYLGVDSFGWRIEGDFLAPVWEEMGLLAASLPGSNGPVSEVVRSRAKQASFGPFTVVVCGPGEVSADALEAELLAMAPATIEHHTVTTEVEVGGTRLASFRFPCRKGSKGFASTSRGQQIVSDLEVEVASQASVIDPEVSPILEGAVCLWDTRGLGSARVDAASGLGPVRTLTLTGIGEGIFSTMPRERLSDERSLAGGLAELGVQGGAGLSASVRLE